MANFRKYPLIGVTTAALLLAGCGDGEGQTDTAAVTAERPAEQQATLTIEGRPEPVQLRRWETPAGFAVPFSTYVPAELTPDLIGSGEGDGVRFSMGPVSTPEQAAYVHVFFHPVATTEDQAAEIVRAVAEEHGPLGARSEVEIADRYPWALRQFRFGDYTEGPQEPHGWVALGRHGDRWFHLIVEYPPYMGEAFLPRAEVILDRWQWGDTGAGLGGHPGGE